MKASMTTGELEEELRKRLAEGSLDLVPLPGVAQRVLSIANDDGQGAVELAKLVQQDAALAASVLRRANSAGEAGATRIASVQQAIARLGSRKVAETAIATSLRQGVLGASRYPDLMQRMWRHSLASGLFAKEIARSLRTNVELAFLAGLLWRIGEALALVAVSDEPEWSSADASVVAGAAEHLGEELAGLAARRWNLPEAIASAIDPAAPEGRTRRLARLARRLAENATEEIGIENEQGHADAVALNLYPEDLESIGSRADAILEECEAIQ